MESKERLRKHLRNLKKNDFVSNCVKILFLIAFVVLVPFIIYESFIKKDIITAVVLILAEAILIVVTGTIIKSAKEYCGIDNSRIYKCTEAPDSVTEIIITPSKIHFEIKGMEDETLYLKESHYRTSLIFDIKKVFGEEKIVNNY